MVKRQSDIFCVNSGKEEESVDNVFLQCEVAFKMWSNFLGRCGFAWCCPKSIVDVTKSWLDGCFMGCDRILWSMIPFVNLEGNE